MLTLLQAAILGLLQGLTELFPVSSLGHSVIITALLGWSVDQSASYFLPFLVLTHLATALVLFLYFWRDWFRILTRDHRLLYLLIIGTIPAGLVGLIFEKKLEALFSEPRVAAIFMVGNGIMLLLAEVLRRRGREETGGDGRLSKLSWLQAFGVGAAQILGLFPGLSRSGASLGGGLLAGLSHEDALRFSFLLATPIIGAAAILELPKLALAQNVDSLMPAVVGALCAGVAAYFSIKFLVRYFKTNTLWPFAIYCLAAGAIAYFLL